MAQQFHALLKDEEEGKHVRSHMKRKTRKEGESSPTKPRRERGDGESSPKKPRKEKEQEDDTCEEYKPPKNKAMEVAAAKKEEIRKQQEQEERKRTKAASPLERAKAFLTCVAKQLGDLMMASAEIKGKHARANVPQAFLKEYASTVEGHIRVLTESRDKMERSQCKDARLFARRCPEEMLSNAQAELSKCRKTLKAWQNCVHVYGDDVSTKQSSSAKTKASPKAT